VSDPAREEIVPVVRIGDVLRLSDPSQVKIDCEGGEYQIIESVCAWGSVRAIAMEVHLPAMGLGQEGDYEKLLKVVSRTFEIVKVPQVKESDRHVMLYARR
jgi:hypothetical protein